MESMLGIGMILGPILGSVVYGEMNFMYACLFFSALNFLMIPVLYFLVGKLRDYEFLRKNPISLLDLVKKQKIALDALVQVIVMIAYGILIPSYGSHFTKYSLSETQAGYFYAICAFSYLVSSLLVSFLPSEWNKPRLMFFGTLVMAFGFLMIGPCTIIFPDTLLIAIIGLVVIGVGGGFMFVFCVPHMIEVAIEDYQFPKDDYLHDSLSKLNNVSMCIGDIIGPTFSTVMCSFIGFSNTANIFFIILIIFGLTYGVLSDAFWFKIVPSEDREVLNIKES